MQRKNKLNDKEFCMKENKLNEKEKITFTFGIVLIEEAKEIEIEIETQSEEEAFSKLPNIMKEKYPFNTWYYNGKIKRVE
ncbi:MAG: hypothetical protein NZM09_12085 [Ignavibacterium sp.]|nr:hypothetical protein [Ignavibacterium sp.]MDW8376414.1 hypothetical protein [Ignavibacteriales bacterium]